MEIDVVQSDFIFELNILHDIHTVKKLCSNSCPPAVDFETPLKAGFHLVEDTTLANLVFNEYRWEIDIDNASYR